MTDRHPKFHQLCLLRYREICCRDEIFELLVFLLKSLVVLLVANQELFVLVQLLQMTVIVHERATTTSSARSSTQHIAS